MTAEVLVPAHSEESERYIIGAVLWHPDMIAEVSDVLKPEHFYRHSRWWSGILSAYEQGLTMDVATVGMEVKKAEGWRPDQFGENVYELSRISQEAFSYSNIMYHALIVAQLWIQREAVRLGSDAMREGGDSNADAFDMTERLAQRATELMDSVAPKRSVSYADAEGDELERMDLPKKAIHTSGFAALNKIIGGYQRGDLIIVAARPAMGKSSFAISSASEGADAGHPTGLFSLELNQPKMQARLFARRGGVPLAAIVRDELTTEQVRKRHESLSGSSDWPLWVRYDTNITVSDIRAETTRMVRKHKVGCIVIDQLNWIKPPKAANRDSEVGAITRGLKQMALQLDIAVVLLHQLNREVESRGGEKLPRLSDLRDSGNVEQDAQVVLFLHRPEYYGITEDEEGSTIGIVNVIVAKNSNGPTETVRLRFNAETASVHNVAPEFNPRGGMPHPDNRTTSEVPPF